MAAGDDGSGQILDPELSVGEDEYIKRRRLKAINDAREAVTRYLPRARAEQIGGKLSERERQILLVETVQAFLRESKNALKKIEEAEDVLLKEAIGRWQIQRPQTGARLVDIEGLSGACDVRENTVVVNGLLSVANSEPVLKLHWEVRETRHYGADRVRQHVSRQPFSAHIALISFDMATGHLDEAGLNYSFSTGEDTIFGFDQSGDEPQAEYGTATYKGDPEL